MDIYYLTAWASDKKYGKALNSHIKHLPDDSWIVVMDGDTCFLTEDYGTIIEEAIEDNPAATLMTCRTNRSYNQQFLKEENIVEGIIGKRHILSIAMPIGFDIRI